MNRWTQVNCASLAAILIALLLLAGHSPPHTEPSSTMQPAPAAVSVVDERPAETEPSGVRGLTVGELLQDAWAAYDTLPATEPSGQYSFVPEYSASYDGAPATYSADFFTIESSNHPGVFHVFGMVAAQRA